MRIKIVFALLLFVAMFAQPAHAASVYSQSVTLAPGWNVVSTPRVLESHTFSAAETSTNFDIFVLDAAQPSGWATMAQEGQTEFTPLFGYFVNNKTNANQTLTFNYLASTTPSQRLFERTFSKAGWYSIGAANPSYALSFGTGNARKNGTSHNILSSLGSNYDNIIDFVGRSSSVAIESTWKAVSYTLIQAYDNFRDLKGFAVHIASNGAGAHYAGFQNDDQPVPFFGSTTVTIANASTTVPSRTIVSGTAGQVLGGFEVTNRPDNVVSMGGIVLGVSVNPIASTTATSTLLTDVTITDDVGRVVAEARNMSRWCNGDIPCLTFSLPNDFLMGSHTYTVRGRVSPLVASGTQITLTANTDVFGLSPWQSPSGVVFDTEIILDAPDFNMNTMTVIAAPSGSLKLGLSTTPASQNIVSSGSGVLFANVQLDAIQSIEDIRVTGIPLHFSQTIGLSSCQLFDGTTALNTGSNIPTTYLVNATSTFTFDNSLIVATGTVKTLALKCNLNAGTGSYQVTLNANDTVSATGQTSGSTVTVAFGNLSGGTMAVAAGALSITLDSSSPSYAVATAGSTGVILGSYKFHATNEAVNLARVGLMMTSATASSTSTDLTQVTLWANGVQIGTATFVGTDTHATSTALTNVQVPKDGDLIVTVKGDLATQGSSAASHPGALIQIDVDTNGATGNKNTSGTGVSSGTTIGASGTTAVSGVRVFKSYPTFAKLAPQSTTLVAQGGVELYRFSVTANAAGDIAMDKLVVNIATSSVSTSNGTTSVSNVNVYAYTDSALSNPVSGFLNGIVATVNSGGGVTSGNNALTFVSPHIIPAGQTRWFKVVGDVTQAAGSTGSAGSVTTKIVGDSAYPSLSTLMGTVSSVSSSNFIWSPLSTTTTAATTNNDWTNGYQIPGLPSSGMDSVTLSK